MPPDHPELQQGVQRCDPKHFLESTQGRSQPASVQMHVLVYFCSVPCYKKLCFSVLQHLCGFGLWETVCLFSSLLLVASWQHLCASLGLYPVGKCLSSWSQYGFFLYLVTTALYLGAQSPPWVPPAVGQQGFLTVGNLWNTSPSPIQQLSFFFFLII